MICKSQWSWTQLRTRYVGTGKIASMDIKLCMRYMYPCWDTKSNHIPAQTQGKNLPNLTLRLFWKVVREKKFKANKLQRTEQQLQFCDSKLNAWTLELHLGATWEDTGHVLSVISTASELSFQVLLGKVVFQKWENDIVRVCRMMILGIRNKQMESL